MNNNKLLELESLHIKLKQIDELHNAVYDNYLGYTVDYDDESPENQMKVRELCVTHTTYTTLLEIAQDIIREVKADVRRMIDTTATQ